ncbi:Hypothetical protein CINCED_3A016770 [Cinara cedri]|uniref:Uncharacterized protein n=1 Tax=Cinara cedri TaxID=506608 RepID=A0A5E4M8H6_9HEMI|nr:Hypothetical protein CINCED_3A016770 [Cinara cedri]
MNLVLARTPNSKCHLFVTIYYIVMKLKEYMVKVHITKKLCINGTTKVGISKMKVDTFFTNFQIQSEQIY